MADDGLSRLSKTILTWRAPKGGKILQLQFDAVTTETKDDSVTITDHPVEEGSNVSDHARDDPAMLSIEALISGIPTGARDNDDAAIALRTITVNRMSAPGTMQVDLDIPSVPIGLSQTGLIQAGVGALVGLFSGGPKATMRDAAMLAQYSTEAAFLIQDSPRTPHERGRDAYEMLLSLKSEHIMLDQIVTAFREYSNMMISRLSQPRAVGDGTSAKFQIDFKQIRIVASQTVGAPKPAPSAVRAKASVAKGAQNPKPIDPDAKHKTLAAGALDQVSNYFAKAQ